LIVIHACSMFGLHILIFVKWFLCFQVKTFVGLEFVEVLFLLICILNVLVAIGLTIDRLVELPKYTPDYTFAIILFINIGTT